MTRILVIEDEAPIRDSIVDILEYAGYDVVSASNGINGLALAQSQSPDLILCDIMLPGLDGYGVKLALNEEPLASARPFIFLTARSAREDMRQGMAMGADDFLIKPFTSRELLESVAARLHRHQQIASSGTADMEHIREYINLTLPHELRTPLTGILGYLTMLRDGLDTLDVSAQRGMIDQVEQSALRLHRLIERYMAYAQLRLIAQTPELIESLRELGGDVPLSLVLRQIAEIHAEQAERQADLELDLEPGSAAIVSEHFERLASALLENAFKFSEPGTAVRVVGRAHGTGYTFDVSDHGRGMTAEQIARVGPNIQFERRFYEQQGVGLGLATAQQIVQIYGGQMDVLSTPGAGTTVRANLPGL